MKKEEWKQIIRKACEGAGTYQEYFEPVIESLADVLAKRDDAEAQYQESGGKPVAVHQNKGGHKNIVKNPALVVYMDLNSQALSFWRDLGLTPAGLKKLNADALTAKATADGFEQLLAKIGG